VSALGVFGARLSASVVLLTRAQSGRESSEPDQVLLYELNTTSKEILSLSAQEYVAAQVNRFLERIRGPNSVTVENDLFVTPFGAPTTSGTSYSCPPSPSVLLEYQDNNVMGPSLGREVPLARPWRDFPHLLLAKSLLSIKVKDGGQRLVVSYTPKRAPVIVPFLFLIYLSFFFIQDWIKYKQDISYLEHIGIKPARARSWAEQTFCALLTSDVPLFVYCCLGVLVDICRRLFRHSVLTVTANYWSVTHCKCYIPGLRTLAGLCCGSFHDVRSDEKLLGGKVRHDISPALRSRDSKQRSEVPLRTTPCRLHFAVYCSNTKTDCRLTCTSHSAIA
jgi:hypothetical protein